MTAPDPPQKVAERESREARDSSRRGGSRTRREEKSGGRVVDSSRVRLGLEWSGCERWEERLVLAQREGQSRAWSFIHSVKHTHTHSRSHMRAHACMRRKSCVLRLRQKKKGSGREDGMLAE